MGVSLATSPTLIDHYTAVVLSSTDYYAGGMSMPGRSFSSSSYRYGFNGKEDDKETGYQDYGMRMYNPKLARFFRVDPIGRNYPYLTPYQFASNSPITGADLDGLEWYGKNTLFTYSESGGTVAIGYGFSGQLQQGVARDVIGKTQYTQVVALAPWNQDLAAETSNPQFSLGADLNIISAGILIHKQPTFSRATGAVEFDIPNNNVSDFDLSSYTDAKGKFNVRAKLGIGLTTNSQAFGLSAGFTAGATFKTGDQDYIKFSISVTFKESDMVEKLGSGSWELLNDKNTPIKNSEGKITGYSNTVGVRNKNGGIDATTVKVYTPAIYDDNGVPAPADIWKSESYIEGEKNVTEE